jgi:phage tail tube protein FII
VPNFPLVLEYANLFCGSAPDDDNASNHLVLTEVKLPMMELQYVDHRAGGAPVAIEIDVIISRMELEFEIVGVTPQIMVLLRSMELTKNNFFVYGNLRDYMGGESIQLAAHFRGQLGRIEPRPFRRGDVFHMRYQVRGLTAYNLFIANNPILRWNFFENTYYVGDNIVG